MGFSKGSFAKSFLKTDKGWVPHAKYCVQGFFQARPPAGRKLGLAPSLWKTEDTWPLVAPSSQEPLLTFAKGPIQNEMECNKARKWMKFFPGATGFWVSDSILIFRWRGLACPFARRDSLFLQPSPSGVCCQSGCVVRLLRWFGFCSLVTFSTSCEDLLIS